jgi:hypothetical protein
MEIMHFEDFINEMSDFAYEYWLDNEASARQKEIALQIREELSDEDEEVASALAQAIVDTLEGTAP